MERLQKARKTKRQIELRRESDQGALESARGFLEAHPDLVGKYARNRLGFWVRARKIDFERGKVFVEHAKGPVKAWWVNPAFLEWEGVD